MKKKIFCFWLLLIAVGMAGCGPGDSGKATPEDEKAIKKLATEGIGSAPPGQSSEPTPANGVVAPP
jgi:hypothetical protein